MAATVAAYYSHVPAAPAARSHVPAQAVTATSCCSVCFCSHVAATAAACYRHVPAAAVTFGHLLHLRTHFLLAATRSHRQRQSRLSQKLVLLSRWGRAQATGQVSLPCEAEAFVSWDVIESWQIRNTKRKAACCVSKALFFVAMLLERNVDVVAYDKEPPMGGAANNEFSSRSYCTVLRGDSSIFSGEPPLRERQLPIMVRVDCQMGKVTLSSEW